MDTRRRIAVYTEKKDIDKALIFLAFFFSFWSIIGALLSFCINRIVSASFIAASVLLVFAGIYVIAHGIFRERDLSYLKEKGIRVSTAYSDASNDDVLITTGTNPLNGKMMTFKSKECWFKHEGVLKDKDRIDVYFDPKKPSRYYMDFSPFEKRINELLDPGD